jgi:K+-transporting ATPase ATPase C chain
MRYIVSMTTHIRAQLVLAGLTLVICCVAYPLVLLGAGKVLSGPASGSLIEKDGKVVGSRLIAQKFTRPEYFWPRPSSADYNASASGASNWGANNVKLRDRAARQLGPVVRYRDGKPVGKDVEDWFREHPDLLAQWAERYPTLSDAWVNGDADKNKVITGWLQDRAAAVAAWKEQHLDAKDDAVFFALFAAENPGTVPAVEEGKVKAVAAGADVQGWFFDQWLQAHADKAKNIEPVPADMVTASGSGLDPHISLCNARFQTRRVVEERTRLYHEVREKAGRPAPDAGRVEAAVRRAVERLVNEHAVAPLWGLAGGDPVVNVLELNLALDDALGRLDVD